MENTKKFLNSKVKAVYTKPRNPYKPFERLEVLLGEAIKALSNHGKKTKNIG